MQLFSSMHILLLPNKTFRLVISFCNFFFEDSYYKKDPLIQSVKAFCPVGSCDLLVRKLFALLCNSLLQIFSSLFHSTLFALKPAFFYFLFPASPLAVSLKLVRNWHSTCFSCCPSYQLSLFLLAHQFIFFGVFTLLLQVFSCPRSLFPPGIASTEST